MFGHLLGLLGLRPCRPQRTVQRRRRTFLVLEALQDRIVPSVSVALNGNTLNIIDTDPNGTDHTINVNQTATQGTFTVQVDAGPVLTFIGVANINANLGADSDNLNFNNGGFTTNLSGNLSVTAQDGANNVSVDFSTIKGNATVTEGNGSDTVAVGGNSGSIGIFSSSGATTINGNLSVTLGDGANDAVDVGVNSGYLYQGSSGATTIKGNLS